MRKVDTSASRHQTVQRHGKDITVRTYEKTGEDDYGENYSETTGSPYTITARAWDDTRSAEDRDNREAGEESGERLFLIRDNADGVDELTEGGGRGASEIDEGDETYYLLEIDENSDGTLTLQTVRD